MPKKVERPFRRRSSFSSRDTIAITVNARAIDRTVAIAIHLNADDGWEVLKKTAIVRSPIVPRIAPTKSVIIVSMIPRVGKYRKSMNLG